VRETLGEQGKMASVEVGDFLENIAFQKLKRLLNETVGLDCNCYRDDYLKRRFAVRLRATGTKTYSRYVRYLKKNATELPLVLNDLTINFTSFFRDMDVYVYLEKTILPRLFKSLEVRIWSAGCATGEEPYSLAILVHKLQEKETSNCKVTIFASDLDDDALAKAAKGEYNAKQLKGVDEAVINTYFSNNGTSYRVKDNVKRLIRFEKHDLMKPFPHKGLDLILCRNVMIFFSRESQRQVHMHFYDALRDWGYLVTGKSEILGGKAGKKFLCTDVNCRVYQKPWTGDGYRVFGYMGVAGIDTPSLNNPVGGQWLVVQ
jgi:chemotaxis protein methyltransferase CheR